MATADPVAPAAAEFRIPVTYADMFFGEWNQDKTTHFMEHTHLPVTLVVFALYLLMVKFGPMVMKNRKGYDLRTALALWNFGLSFYSGISLYILWPHNVKSYNKGGVLGTICYIDDLYTNPESGWWGWLYCMSKGPELIDTLFLVLRKRPVIFLHWYHHSVTFLLGQLFYTQYFPWVRPGVIINLGVHTIMYFYYGMRAWGIKTDRWVSKAITLTQITQFISGGIIGLHWINAWFYDNLQHCEKTKIEWISVLGVAVVASYLYLFMRYYQDAYIKNASPTQRKIEEPEEAKEAKKDQ